MNPWLESLFGRWTAGERSAGLFVYGAVAAPASTVYRLGLTLKPHLRRHFTALRNSRVIVVSSPSVGGVGKTPIAAYIVSALSGQGKRTAVVTMGYGRKSNGPAKLETSIPGVPAEFVGDEAAELFLRTRCPAYVGEEPAEVIAELDSQKSFDWIVFDDGVSRAWKGERRVVILSDTDMSAPVRYLPFGSWRTTPDFVRAASYVAITSQSETVSTDSHIKRLNEWGYRGPVGAFAYTLDGIERYNGDHGAPAPAERPFVFCGIARPERFRESARSLGIDTTVFESLPDHHRHSRESLMKLERLREHYGCGWFLTTMKDAVKIDPAWINSTPLYFLRIALHQVAGPDILPVLTREI